MWHRQPFLSCKLLILKDKRGYALVDGLFNDFNNLQAIGSRFVGHSRSLLLEFD